MKYANFSEGSTFYIYFITCHCRVFITSLISLRSSVEILAQRPGMLNSVFVIFLSSSMSLPGYYLILNHICCLWHLSNSLFGNHPVTLLSIAWMWWKHFNLKQRLICVIFSFGQFFSVTLMIISSIILINMFLIMKKKTKTKNIVMQEKHWLHGQCRLPSADWGKTRRPDVLVGWPVQVSFHCAFELDKLTHILLLLTSVEYPCITI